MNISLKKLNNLFLFFYLFFLSFFNFTPFYLISAIFMMITVVIRIFGGKKLILTRYFYFQLFFILINLAYVVFNKTLSDTSTLAALKTVFLNLSISVALMNSVDNMQDVKKIMKWFVPIATFASIFILIYTRGQGETGRLAHGYPRLFSSTTYTSMEVASWALYGSAISLLIYIKDKNKKILLPYPLFWVIIFLAGSRKCLVLAVLLNCAIFIFTGNNNSQKKLAKKVIIIVFLVILLVVIVMKNDYLYNIIGYRFVGYIQGTESSALSREIMADIAKHYISKKPFLGYGLNTFRNLPEGYGTWCENNYLELSFGCGIVTTGFYYLYLIGVLKKLYIYRKNDEMIQMFLLIICLLVIFDTMTVSYMGRLESFFITIASLIIFFQRKVSNEK